tara:strand:- start:91 stop:615 length:525 start_codon:yes stop_codon:yes gene_type:complete
MFIYETNIDKKICKKLIDVYENDSNKEATNTHRTKMTQLFLNRKDGRLFDYLTALHKILQKYKKKYKHIDEGQQPWELNSTIKIQKYKPGESYFSWHTESTGHQGSNNRVLVFSTFLNDIKKGGETEFFYQKEKVKAQEGKTILFPPFWTHTHKGNVAKETKYIITGWYTYAYK